MSRFCWLNLSPSGQKLILLRFSCRYRSEDEEDEEEEDDDGSSVEEEDEEEHVEEHHHQQGSALGSNSNAALDLAPAYTQPAAGSGVQTGSNGYAVSGPVKAVFQSTLGLLT